MSWIKMRGGTLQSIQNKITDQMYWVVLHIWVDLTVRSICAKYGHQWHPDLLSGVIVLETILTFLESFLEGCSMMFGSILKQGDEGEGVELQLPHFKTLPNTIDFMHAYTHYLPVNMNCTQTQFRVNAGPWCILLPVSHYRTDFITVSWASFFGEHAHTLSFKKTNNLVVRSKVFWA